MTTTFSDDHALPGAADGAPEVPGVGSLVEVINDEIRVFHELLDTLQQEQKAIVADDLPRIEELAATIAELRHGTKQTSSPLDDPLNDPGATEAVPAASASAGPAKPATDDLPADPAPPADEKSAAPSAPAQPSPAP